PGRRKEPRRPAVGHRRGLLRPGLEAGQLPVEQGDEPMMEQVEELAERSAVLPEDLLGNVCGRGACASDQTQKGGRDLEDATPRLLLSRRTRHADTADVLRAEAQRGIVPEANGLTRGTRTTDALGVWRQALEERHQPEEPQSPELDPGEGI